MRVFTGRPLVGGGVRGRGVPGWGVCAAGLVVGLVTLAACGSDTAGSGSTLSPTSVAARPSPPLAQAPPRCTLASKAATAVINASVGAKGEGNSVPTVVSWADPDAGAWWLVGAFAGPAGSGEGALGMWSTTADPTQESFTGPIFSIGGGARGSSTAPDNTVVDYDPTAVPALGCWSAKGS